MIKYEAHIRQVMTQGLLYVASFGISYTPAVIIRVLESIQDETAPPAEQPLYPILVLYSLLLPLQGFFNMFVYNRPTYLKLRDTYPELSWIFVFRIACFHDYTQLSIIKSQNSSGGGGGAGGNSSSGLSYRSSGNSNSMRRGTGGSVTTKAQEKRAKYYNSASSSGRDFSSNLDPVAEASAEDDNFSDFYDGSNNVESSQNDSDDNDDENENFDNASLEGYNNGEKNFYRAYQDELNDQRTTRTYQIMDGDEEDNDDDDGGGEDDRFGYYAGSSGANIYQNDEYDEEGKVGGDTIAMMELDYDSASSTSLLDSEENNGDDQEGDCVQNVKYIVEHTTANGSNQQTHHLATKGMVVSPPLSPLFTKAADDAGVHTVSPYKRISFDGTVVEG